MKNAVSSAKYSTYTELFPFAELVNQMKNFYMTFRILQDY